MEKRNPEEYCEKLLSHRVKVNCRVTRSKHKILCFGLALSTLVALERREREQ
jgi:hypothetical protein